MAIAIFLLSANFDNVPDCPELLNASSGQAMLQVVHHPGAVCLDTHEIAKYPPRPQDDGLQLAIGELPKFLLSSLTLLLDHATDSSPPAV